MGSLQVLISTMYRCDCVDLLQAMNVSSNAVVINQSDYVDYKEFKYKGNDIIFYTSKDRGLSKSRNNALLLSTSEIIALADDDMTYVNGYEEIIVKEFSDHPDADAILFYVERINGTRPATPIKKFEKLKKWEYRNYSSVNIVIKREKLISHNIWFNIIFGSGSIYKCGEDTIFLKNLVDNNFRIYKSPSKIACVDMSHSSWFRGYDKEHFFYKGAVMAAAYPKLCYLLLPIQAFKNSKKRLGSYRFFWDLIRWYLKGINDYKKRLL